MKRGVGLLTHTSVGAPAFANITIRGRGERAFRADFACTEERQRSLMEFWGGLTRVQMQQSTPCWGRRVTGQRGWTRERSQEGSQRLLGQEDQEGRGKEEEWRKHREERKEALEVASATNANMAGA